MKHVNRFILAFSLWNITGIPSNEYDIPLDWHTAFEVAKILYP